MLSNPRRLRIAVGRSACLFAGLLLALALPAYTTTIELLRARVRDGKLNFDEWWPWIEPRWRWVRTPNADWANSACMIIAMCFVIGWFASFCWNRHQTIVRCMKSPERGEIR